MSKALKKNVSATFLTWKEKGKTQGTPSEGPDSVRHRVDGGEEGGGKGGEQDFCSEHTASP